MSSRRSTVVMPTGDPRMPDKVTALPEEKVNQDDLPPDWMAILSLIFGICGLWLRYKWAAWGALFTCIASLANMKPAEIDFKQVAASVTFAIMGLVMNYAAPQPKGAAAAPA
mmetsp:Transcript_25692/g.89495  ORF Transcript_25692/g.89495 Transcript_25692/m.89495 type:complete len:112 (-) Transcript_25692:85-420(-)